MSALVVALHSHYCRAAAQGAAAAAAAAASQQQATSNQHYPEASNSSSGGSSNGYDDDATDANADDEPPPPPPPPHRTIHRHRPRRSNRQRYNYYTLFFLLLLLVSINSVCNHCFSDRQHSSRRSFGESESFVRRDRLELRRICVEGPSGCRNLGTRMAQELLGLRRRGFRFWDLGFKLIELSVENVIFVLTRSCLASGTTFEVV